MTITRRATAGLTLTLFTLILSLAAGCAKPQPLTVTAAFPANGSTGVPASSAVELTFSAPPDKLDDFFTVDPPVEGRFQYMDEAVAFLPAMNDGKGTAWEQDVTYTVTVKAGLKSKDGRSTLAEDYILTFTGGDGSTAGFAMEHLGETFLPDDYPVLDVRRPRFTAYQWNISPQEVFTVAVHRLPDGPRYLRELYRANVLYDEVRVDTAALPEVLTFTQTMAEARLSPEDSGKADIVFPEPLPAGWYVATVTTTRDTVPPVQKLLQIQESAVYTQVANAEILFWYNNTASGQPVAGAELAVIRDPFASMTPEFTAQAGGDGILTLDVSPVVEGERADWPRADGDTPLFFYSLTAPDGTAYYDVVRSRNISRYQEYEQDYYGFLYTDRAVYRQSDTIKFWGVARPRKDAPAISTVSVELSDYQDSTLPPAAAVEAAVSPDGIFTGELSYRDFASGDVGLRVLPAGEKYTDHWDTIATQWLSIGRYKKPLYTAEITTDKLYYRPGENIDTQVAVSLFDRTPAAGVQMRLYAGDYGEGEVLTTGADGVIHTGRKAPDTSNINNYSWGWYPVSYTLRAENEDASDVNLSVSETVYVFPTTVMLDAREERRGEKSDLVITANHIDFEKIPGGRQAIQDYDALKGAGAQLPVTVHLNRITNTRVVLPPVYDRYTRQSVSRVTYQRSEEIVETFREATGPDGVLRLSDILPPEEEGVRYYVEIIVHQGGYQRTSRSLGGGIDWGPQDQEGHYHTFGVRTSQSDENWTGKGAYYYDSESFRFGEEISYQVMDWGVPLTEGTLMTNLLQGTVLSGGVGGTAGTILCDEEKLPDFTLCGAYFDGRRIYPVRPVNLAVLPESRQLTLQLLPGREDYRPGETADVTLRVLDENGRPASGVNLCLGVVDESVFAVQEQYLNMGGDLYGGIFYTSPHVFASYVQHGVNLYYDAGGGKGGGGGDGSFSIRENFKDTAAFVTGRTGADGTLAARVELPDDLTAWRLTGVALDSRAWWGTARSALYTTLPFRIDPILSSTFLSGDTVACTVRGFGTAIGTDSPVSYTATVQGTGEPLEVTAEAPAGELTPLSFRKLPAGEYTMTVTALCGEYSDGVRVPFTVRDSALVFPIHREVALTGGQELQEIQPTQWPVQLDVYSAGRRSFMDAWDLLRWDQSGRGDARLAMAAVRDVVTAAMGDGYEHPAVDLEGVQTTWEDGKGEAGGVRIFSYAEAETDLTARAAVAAPELLDRYTLRSYLVSAYEDTDDAEERAAALMGLAALGKLTDDQRLLLETRARTDGLPVKESAWLIAGLSYLDQPEAQKLYTRQVAPRLTEDRAGLKVPASTAYDTVEDTASALLCAILTGAAEDAEGMIGYLANRDDSLYRVTRGPCQLEAALYLRRFQPKEEELPALRYRLDGQERQITLTAGGCLQLTLDREAFEALDLRSEGGAAIAGVSYTAGPEELGFAPSPRVTVTKTLDTPEDQKHLGGETTVTIKVELDREMPYGQYKLIEWVPSNMRLRRVEEGTGWRYFSWREDEQLLTVDFTYSREYSNIFTFRYTAASVLDTECTLERSYAYCAETMEGGRTEKGDFLPSDYYYLGVGYLFRKA